jgi:hypothetical protein
MQRWHAEAPHWARVRGYETGQLAETNQNNTAPAQLGPTTTGGEAAIAIGVGLLAYAIAKMTK